MTERNEIQPAAETAPTAGAQPMREIDSRELMQDQREIIIRHNGEPYRLSVTRNGKLILHK